MMEHFLLVLERKMVHSACAKRHFDVLGDCAFFFFLTIQ